MTKTEATLIDALNHPEGRDLVDAIEDMLASTDGATRYQAEIASTVAELEELTGYRYEVN